jgi:hypothetical protein
MMETEGNPMNTEVRKTFVESQSLGTVEDTSECVLQHPGTMMKTSLEERSLKNPSPSWWLPILLAIPSLIPLISSLIMARLNGFVATGFVQYDQPYYMASARAYFDQGFHFLFGNPYAGYDTPRLYFQPHLFLLGCFQQLGLDPGITWNIFGVVGALFVAFVAVHFYCEVVGWHSRAEKLGLLCFFWGGGVLVLVGFVYACFVGRFNSLTLLHFDPTLGWWMLNFGRNLVYGPTEAYYHGVFLLCMLFLIRRRFGVAIAFAVLLSFSHPWTGIECSVIVAAYLLVERLYGDKSVKARYLFASIALVFAHLGYYMVFLNRFADHRALQSQWEANGSVRLYPSYVFLPALFIVGSFALVRLIRWPGLRRLVQDPRNRLFMVWFLIVFGITQHYRVMRPIDPIHFAHGYDWMALFFLGSPLLVAVLERLLRIEVSWVRILALSVFLLFFLSDNIGWFATFLRPTTSEAVLETEQQMEVLRWFGQNAVPRQMVVTPDLAMGYLVSTYSRVRSWAGYGASTPHYAQRCLEAKQAFENGVILPAWQTLDVLYVRRIKDYPLWTPPATSREVFHNDWYEIWECPPTRSVLEAQH